MNTRVLAILSEVAGEALTKHLSKILPALMDALKTSVGTPQELEVGIERKLEVLLTMQSCNCIFLVCVLL